MTTVTYSRRATSDIERIARYYRDNAAPVVSARLGRELEGLVQRIAQNPLIGMASEGRPALRVALLLRFPYRIFYRISESGIEIVHIRHVSRKAWLAPLSP